MSGAACLGVFVLFQEDDARAFGEEEPIAVGIEGAGGVLGIVVALGQGFEGDEAAQAERGERGFGAAGDHDIGGVVADGVGGVGDGVGGRGAGGGDGGVGALEPVVDRDIARAGVAHELGHHEGGEPVGAFLHELAVAGFELFDAADAGADDRTAAPRIFLGKIDFGVTNRIDGSIECELGEAIESLGVAFFDVAGLPRVDLAADLDRVLFGIEAFEGADAAATFQQLLPDLGHGRAETGDPAKPGDNHASSIVIHDSVSLGVVQAIEGRSAITSPHADHSGGASRS